MDSLRYIGGKESESGNLQGWNLRGYRGWGSVERRNRGISYALLTFFEGSTIKLEPNTDVEIPRVESAEGGGTEIALKQWLGRTWSRVVKMMDPNSSYEIQTPSAIALVRGTFFTTEVDEAGSTIVQVKEGAVTVAAQVEDVDTPEDETAEEEREVLVSAGYQVSVSLGTLPSQPLPISDDAGPPDDAGVPGQSRGGR